MVKNGGNVYKRRYPDIKSCLPLMIPFMYNLSEKGLITDNIQNLNTETTHNAFYSVRYERRFTGTRKRDVEELICDVTTRLNCPTVI